MQSKYDCIILYEESVRHTLYISLYVQMRDRIFQGICQEAPVCLTYSDSIQLIFFFS